MLVDLGVNVAGILLKNLRCAFFQRFIGVKNGREHLIIHFNELERLVCRLFVNCRYCCNFVANKTHLVDAKNSFVPAGRTEPVLCRGHIAVGNDSFYAGQFFRFGGINIENTGMGVRTV